MNYVFIEFVRLVEMKEFGKALRMSTDFTDEIEDFHEQISSNNSSEAMFSFLTNFKIPLRNWRDFLEEHFYFDDVMLMTKWINIEKKYFRRKWDFQFDQRIFISELDSYKFSIIVHAYHNDYPSADNIWIKVKELLPKVIDDKVKEKWRRFQIIYLIWKRDFGEGKEPFISKITDKLKTKVKKLTNESLILLNQGKVIQSFEKQTKIVKSLEKFLRRTF